MRGTPIVRTFCIPHRRYLCIVIIGHYRLIRNRLSFSQIPRVIRTRRTFIELSGPDLRADYTSEIARLPPHAAEKRHVSFQINFLFWDYFNRRGSAVFLHLFLDRNKRSACHIRPDIRIRGPGVGLPKQRVWSYPTAIFVCLPFGGSRARPRRSRRFPRPSKRQSDVALVDRVRFAGVRSPCPAWAAVAGGGGVGGEKGAGAAAAAADGKIFDFGRKKNGGEANGKKKKTPDKRISRGTRTVSACVRAMTTAKTAASGVYCRNKQRRK